MPFTSESVPGPNACPWLAAAFLLLALLVPFRSASAQLTASDSAAVLLEAAREFQERGEPEVAEALYRLLVERYSATAAGAEAAGWIESATAARTAGSGRVELQVWGTLYGTFLGVTTPAALGVDDPAAYGAGILLGAPAGYFFGRALSRRGATEGQARAITLGGTWGAWQGFGWREVLDIGTGEDCYVFEGLRFCEEEDASEEAFAALIIGSLIGTGAGIVLSERPITPGVASLVNFGSLWGTWFGVAGGVIADLEDDGLLAATLIGGNAGLLSMALLAPGWDMSRNRARLISLAGVLGGLAGGGLTLILQPESDKVTIGIPLAGSIAGLAMGTVTTRGYDQRRITSASEEHFADSLISVSSSGWRIGPPLPTLVRYDTGDGVAREVRLPLLSARF